MEADFMARHNNTNERVPSLSGKEALVLELLLSKPAVEMYGLELVHTSRNRLKRGTIYVTLSRMEDKAYVESRLEQKKADASGLPRRLYRATGYGKRVYEAWQLARDIGRRHFAEIGGAA
jgi:DNA-binding PadR family transcriptional regulator